MSSSLMLHFTVTIYSFSQYIYLDIKFENIVMPMIFKGACYYYNNWCASQPNLMQLIFHYIDCAWNINSRVRIWLRNRGRDFHWHRRWGRPILWRKTSIPHQNILEYKWRYKEVSRIFPRSKRCIGNFWGTMHYS